MCANRCEFGYRRDDNGCMNCACEEPCKVPSDLVFSISNKRIEIVILVVHLYTMHLFMYLEMN